LKNTAANLAVLASLAKAPLVPLEVGIDISKLSNSSKLVWKASANGKVEGYYVLIRETSAPMWEKKIYTKGTSIDLPYSKDNYFFAVKAVNESGEESLAVFPVPVR
jgi:hypothetical protein